MRKAISTVLLIAILFAGGYWYYVAEAGCNAPLSYHIGTIAAQFDLTEEEARAAVSDAESLWEDATGRNLFTYAANGGLAINFVYDERQSMTDEEHKLDAELKDRQSMSEEVRDTYDELTEQYNELKVSYKEKTTSYESRLKAHNDAVASWNEKGGAPEDVYAKLSREQTSLANEQATLNTIATQLNSLASEINKLGERGNGLVTSYNSIVETYNNRFNTEREFTQGEYQSRVINIYQYDTTDELRLVLAHEMGHALSLGHVEGETSIMNHLMDKQTLKGGLSVEDLEEFNQMCGKGKPFALFSRWW